MSLLDELPNLTGEELAAAEQAIASARARARALRDDPRLAVDERGEPLDNNAYQDAHEDAEQAARNAQPAPAVKPFTPPDTTGDTQSWDDYWARVEEKRRAERGNAPTTLIRGVEVTVPTSLPLRFDRDLERLQESEDLADVQRLLVELFGRDVLDQWVDAGMHEEEFRTALLWGIARGKRRDLTFEQAHELVMRQGEALRAPANRAERRAPGKSGKRKSGKRRATR